VPANVAWDPNGATATLTRHLSSADTGILAANELGWALLCQDGTFAGPAGTFRQRTEITKPQAAIPKALEISTPPRIYQLKPPVEA
jgi:hypothetical protein